MLDKLDVKAVEAKWLQRWEELGIHRFDDSDAKKPVFSIDSPPPFTSGALHMGHVLSYAYFDFAARYKRMTGFNVFYPQGWDCQGFPTEVKVEQKYGRSLPRAEFKQKCVEFTKENIEKMRSQMRRLGFSPDWRHEYRTMDSSYHQKVQLSLLQMYEKGLVYRGRHPVQFCTTCGSAIAKAETEEVERQTLLSTLEFRSANGGKSLLIATTRPEYLHACVAILVHPGDERYRDSVGKEFTVPLHNQKVKVLADPDVDPVFGTGAVMLCTFGDKQDVVWAYRHKLPIIEALDERGLLQNAGKYSGEHISKARAVILEDLAAQKLVSKQETLNQVVKTHDRCKKTVEFILSWQWFIKVKHAHDEIVAAARTMRWIPEFSIQYLVDWADALEYDWVISRQRVYGTPLPFYYCTACNEIYLPAPSELPVDPAHHPYANAKCKCGGEIKGETSTADVWVDSSISPLVIAGWPDGKHFKRLYPATLRPQGLEIIRTWAFYTIFRCLELTSQPPFRDVLINGNVLGTDGKKMSKSLGNYEDPEVLLQKYSADALRQWAALSGAFAKDRPFSYKDVDRAQSFVTKLWNAAKFVQRASEGYLFDENEKPSAHLRLADRALLSKLHRLIRDYRASMENYDYYSALNAVHSFVWNEFCDYYLEEVKHRVYDAATPAESKRAARYALNHILHAVLKLLAPFAPFVTEEIYQQMYAKSAVNVSLHATLLPVFEESLITPSEEEVLNALNDVLGAVRRFKAGKNLALNEAVASATITVPENLLARMADVEEEIRAAGKISTITFQAGDAISAELVA